jgi:hypothetical protein
VLAGPAPTLLAAAAGLAVLALWLAPKAAPKAAPTPGTGPVR